MSNHRLSNFLFLASAMLIMASCAITSHPNEKIIVGKWKPVTVEKYIDSTALAAVTAQSKGQAQGGSRTKSKQPDSLGGVVSTDKVQQGLDRLIKVESSATLEVFPDKTAVKDYRGKPMKVTWKLKGNGTRLVAKDLSSKKKHVLDLEDVTDNQLVVIEETRVGFLRITYTRMEDSGGVK